MTAIYTFVDSRSRKSPRSDTIGFADIFACLAARDARPEESAQVDPALDIPVSLPAARHSWA